MGKAEASVEELVGMIERGELRLPEMQRRYVLISFCISARSRPAKASSMRTNSPRRWRFIPPPARCLSCIAADGQSALF